MKRTSATSLIASTERAEHASWTVKNRNLLLTAGFVLFSGLMFVLGRNTAPPPQSAMQALAAFELDLQAQQSEVDKLRFNNELNVNALAVRLAELQAASTRLDALGERLAQMGQLSLDEFDFSEPAPMGGSGDLDTLGPSSEIDLRLSIVSLSEKLRRQAMQLDALQSLMVNRQLESDLTPTGWPVRKGWISSRFGERSDPLTGERTMHWGNDFSGVPGTDVLSVASGVVVWSAPRATYGNTVEIDHGNGFITRYAHNRDLAVKAGDQVTAGQMIASLGSTGRVSGPHVHFEVIKDGKRVNPSKFVKQLR